MFWVIIPHFRGTGVTQEAPTAYFNKASTDKFNLVHQQDTNYAHFKDQKIVTQKRMTYPKSQSDRADL